MKIYGLIGRSLGHSFSKKYFTEKFTSENYQNCIYSNFELDCLGDNLEELKKNIELSGLNVTIPYKTEIISFLDEVTEDTLRVNACNCIKIENGKWIGYNTDVIGFEKSFIPGLKPGQVKALILGTGGAAKAVAFVLKKLCIEFAYVSRSKTDLLPALLFEDISGEILNEFPIVINATPSGMYPNIDDYPNLPYELVSSQHYFYDLIYNPLKTKFLEKAEAKGATIQNGEEMLRIQAEESWKIWNS
ncbi:MAG: shikimate dehydrogenase [Ginsengibacter sp.]